MSRCLVQRWGANAQALFISADGQCEFFPIQLAAMRVAHNFVASFLD